MLDRPQPLLRRLPQEVEVQGGEGPVVVVVAEEELDGRSSWRPQDRSPWAVALHLELNDRRECKLRSVPLALLRCGALEMQEQRTSLKQNHHDDPITEIQMSCKIKRSIQIRRAMSRSSI